MRASAKGLAFASVFVTSTVALPAFAQDLAPPPPMSSPPSGAPNSPGAPADGTTMTPEGETTRKLDEAEKKDSGRNFELIWVDGSAGASYLNLGQFSSEKMGIAKTDAVGPSFSLGAGVRLVVFVAGVRARYGSFDSFDLWQLNGEAGLKIPIGSLDFLLTAHGGYATTGSVSDAAARVGSDVSVSGFNAGLDVGLDYYISPLFSIGAGVVGDVLVLKRPQLDKPPGFDRLTPEEQQQVTSSPLYSAAGTAVGLQFGGGLRLGLHFGL